MIPGSRGRVLVVDDEPAFAGLCAEQLQWAGFAVTAVGSSAEALAALDGSAFDAVISDIRMPGLSGIELLRLVRERDLLVPVVLMTGDASVETAAQAVDLGALQYLTKPVPEKDLVAAATRAVRLRKVLAARGDFLLHVGSRDRLVWDRTGLEVRFDRALATLRMDYQPIVSAGDGGLYGMEALVRTAEDAFSGPEALFLAGGRLGRVTEVGRAVRAAVAEWLARRGPAIVFVNVHPEELMDPAFYDPGEPLSSHARNVVLEITERSNLSQIPDVQRRIRVLRGLGYRIAIDDLGAGHSGLAAVTAFEPQFVKLDISLVARCDQEPVKRNLMAAMSSFAHDTGILVVAEGIETEAEKAVAVSEGCDLLQGFLLGRPAPAP